MPSEHEHHNKQLSITTKQNDATRDTSTHPINNTVHTREDDVLVVLGARVDVGVLDHLEDHVRHAALLAVHCSDGERDGGRSGEGKRRGRVGEVGEM